MQAQDKQREVKVPWRRRVPLGLVVTFALLALLHGPLGAVIAVANQCWHAVAALLGGQDVVVAVLSQTAPLALATAVITLLYCRKWITFESMWSVLACAAILIGGASIGAELRGTFEQFTPPAEATQAIAASAVAPSPDGATLAWLVAHTNQRTNQLPAREAIQALTTWEYVSQLGATEQWPARVPRIALLPESNTWLGVVGRGLNQLLGYLVIYRPRMFLAALLAGGYVGWMVHRRLEKAHDAVTDISYRMTARRAA